MRTEFGKADTFGSDPMWVQMAMVIVAGLLFLVAGVFGLLIWAERRTEKRAELSDIRQRVEEIRAQRAAEESSTDKLSVQQIQDRIRQERSNDQSRAARGHDDVPYGKHALRSEDDHPTKRIPVYGDPAQTEPITRLVRPYLDRPRHD